MSAFYICSDCDEEFLDADELPVVTEADHVGPICYRCQEQYNCCVGCEAWFQPDMHEGDPTGDLCKACWIANAKARKRLLSAIFES